MDDGIGICCVEGIYGLSMSMAPADHDCISQSHVPDKQAVVLRNWLVQAVRAEALYVCSLCLSSDDLGLWREYGGSGGAALGVPLEPIISYSQQHKEVQVLPVEYNRQKQFEMVADVTMKLADYLADSGGESLEIPMPSDLAKSVEKLTQRRAHG